MGYNWDLTHNITWDIPYITGCISYGNSFSGWSSHGHPWRARPRGPQSKAAFGQFRMHTGPGDATVLRVANGATFWGLLDPFTSHLWLIFSTLPMFFSIWTFGEVARSCRALAGYHAKRGPQHTTTGIYCWLIPRFLLVSPPCYINTKKNADQLGCCMSFIKWIIKWSNSNVWGEHPNDSGSSTINPTPDSRNWRQS